MISKSRFPFLVLFALFVAGCQTFVRLAETPEPEGVGTVVYVVGDFGFPSPALFDNADAIARQIEQDESVPRTRTTPVIVELGDNLYPSGLPRPGVEDRDGWRRLAAIATAFGRCVFREAPVPVVLLPGNHDYDGDALTPERTHGDITRWYFLRHESLPETIRSWSMVPGSTVSSGWTPSELYENLYSSPAKLARFMAPSRIPEVGPHLEIVAIDSELLTHLYADGHDALAAQMIEKLRERLREIPPGKWRFVASHHPVLTYGEHRPLTFGRLLLGPGWPQYAEVWSLVVAIPPLGTVATVGRWAAFHRQDFHSSPQRRFRDALIPVLQEAGVTAILSGHDHNLQLLELPPGTAGRASSLQIISGAGTNIDSVTRGKETLAYHCGRGFVRLFAQPDALAIELYDRHGELIGRLRLDRSDESDRSAPEPPTE